jgi:hypothetical protein
VLAYLACVRPWVRSQHQKLKDKKKKRQEVNNASENVREKESLYITDRNVENSVEFLLKSQK